MIADDTRSMRDAQTEAASMSAHLVGEIGFHALVAMRILSGIEQIAERAGGGAGEEIECVVDALRRKLDDIAALSRGGSD